MYILNTKHMLKAIEYMEKAMLEPIDVGSKPFSVEEIEALYGQRANFEAALKLMKKATGL